MLGFGLTGAVMCTAKGWFERNWQWACRASPLLLFGPLIVSAHLLARQIPVEAMFLASDPAQKWRLFASFILYMLPFLAGALFLGIVFLKARRRVRPRVFRRPDGLRAVRPPDAGGDVRHRAAEPADRAAAAVAGGRRLWFWATGRMRAVAWIGLGRRGLDRPLCGGAAGGIAGTDCWRTRHGCRLRAEWSRALAWAILAVASIAALSLVVLPLVYGWRTIFAATPASCAPSATSPASAPAMSWSRWGSSPSSARRSATPPSPPRC